MWNYYQFSLTDLNLNLKHVFKVIQRPNFLKTVFVCSVQYDLAPFSNIKMSLGFEMTRLADDFEYFLKFQIGLL